MIRIVRVTNPIDPTRDQVVREVAADGLSLFALLGSEPDHAAIHAFVNGHLWASSLWTEVTPKDGDCIVIAPVVRGGGLLRTLATVAVLIGSAALAASGVGSVFAAIGLSSISTATGGAILAGAASIGGNLLISAFLSPANKNKGGSSASYDPDGPKTLAQSGTVIPKGYGTFMWGGNIVSSFEDVDGSDTYLNVLVCYGFGPARSISGIQINGKDIYEYNDAVYFTRMGTNDQAEIPNFNRIVNGYPQQIQCLAGQAVVVPGTGDETDILQVDIQFPDGIFVDTNDGNVIPAVITYQVEYAAAGTGDWKPAVFPQNTTPVITHNPDGSVNMPYAWGAVATDLPPGTGVCYALDNGPHTPGDPWTGTITCENFAPNGNHYNYDKPCRGEWQLLDPNLNYVVVTSWSDGYVDFVADQTTTCYNRTTIYLPYQGKWDVQVTKYGSTRLHDDVPFGDNYSPNVGQDMWVHSVNEITNQDLCYPNMILLGVRALATSQLSGSGINVTAVIEHGLRSKDEGLLPADLLDYEEDNPACVTADMFVDDLYGGGAWPGISAFNLARFIDEWIAWAELNDSLVPDGNGNSIRMNVFNGICDNEADLWTQAGTVASMSRACLVPVGTDYGVATDQPVDAPVQMFSVGNILQDSFSETWLPIDERANQVEVQFADATRYYREDNPLVYMDPADMNSGAIVKNTRIRGKGITVPAQAWHFARYKQRSTEFLLRSGSFRTDTDGVACKPFNVVAIQHDVPQWGIGGRTLPGSTASLLLLDRNDAAMTSGTNYSVMVQHAALQRFSGTVSAVATSTSPAGYILTIAGWSNTARVTRAIVNGNDCAVALSNVNAVIVTAPPGFTPANGQTCVLWDTDLLETAPVSGIDPATGGLQLSTPLSRVPADFSNYIFGPAGSTKLVRVTAIRKASELRSTIEYIDYDPGVYTVGTPLIGETSAQVTTNPGVLSLTGSEIFQKVGGSYVTFARLAWKPGPNTAGVGIYARIVGGTGQPKLVARLQYATSWQGQQAVGSEIEYTVVGFDSNDLFAAFGSAPSVTINAVGIAQNLLLGSSFASGFAYWSIAPRAGDTFAPSFGDDGEATYTVAGSALTAATVLAFQEIPSTKWAIGDYLMLSAYFATTGTPTGNLVADIQFMGTSTTTARAVLTMAGAAQSLIRVSTPAVQVPAGTTRVIVRILVDGSSLSVPVGATLTANHLLLEEAAAGQTTPSAWADIDATGQILDLFTLGSSAGLRTQASTLPVTSGTISYTFTDTTVTINCSGLAIAWPDGGITYIQDASTEITGLTASTSYWFALYFDVLTGQVQFSNAGATAGTPEFLFAAANALALANCSLDGRVCLTASGVTVTTAATVGGGGVGTGGGGIGGSGGGPPYSPGPPRANPN